MADYSENLKINFDISGQDKVTSSIQTMLDLLQQMGVSADQINNKPIKPIIPSTGITVAKNIKEDLDELGLAIDVLKQKLTGLGTSTALATFINTNEAILGSFMASLPDIQDKLKTAESDISYFVKKCGGMEEEVLKTGVSATTAMDTQRKTAIDNMIASLQLDSLGATAPLENFYDKIKQQSHIIFQTLTNTLGYTETQAAEFVKSLEFMYSKEHEFPVGEPTARGMGTAAKKISVSMDDIRGSLERLKGDQGDLTKTLIVPGGNIPDGGGTGGTAPSMRSLQELGQEGLKQQALVDEIRDQSIEMGREFLRVAGGDKDAAKKTIALRLEDLGLRKESLETEIAAEKDAARKESLMASLNKTEADILVLQDINLDNFKKRVVKENVYSALMKTGMRGGAGSFLQQAGTLIEQNQIMKKLPDKLKGTVGLGIEMLGNFANQIGEVAQAAILGSKSMDELNTSEQVGYVAIGTLKGGITGLVDSFFKVLDESSKARKEAVTAAVEWAKSAGELHNAGIMAIKMGAEIAEAAKKNQQVGKGLYYIDKTAKGGRGGGVDYQGGFLGMDIQKNMDKEAFLQKTVLEGPDTDNALKRQAILGAEAAEKTNAAYNELSIRLMSYGMTLKEAEDKAQPYNEAFAAAEEAKIAVTEADRMVALRTQERAEALVIRKGLDEVAGSEMDASITEGIQATLRGKGTLADTEALLAQANKAQTVAADGVTMAQKKLDEATRALAIETKKADPQFLGKMQAKYGLTLLQVQQKYGDLVESTAQVEQSEQDYKDFMATLPGKVAAAMEQENPNKAIQDLETEERGKRQKLFQDKEKLADDTSQRESDNSDVAAQYWSQLYQSGKGNVAAAKMGLETEITKRRVILSTYVQQLLLSGQLSVEGAEALRKAGNDSGKIALALQNELIKKRGKGEDSSSILKGLTFFKDITDLTTTLSEGSGGGTSISKLQRAIEAYGQRKARIDIPKESELATGQRSDKESNYRKTELEKLEEYYTDVDSVMKEVSKEHDRILEKIEAGKTLTDREKQAVEEWNTAEKLQTDILTQQHVIRMKQLEDRIASEKEVTENKQKQLDYEKEISQTFEDSDRKKEQSGTFHGLGQFFTPEKDTLDNARVEYDRKEETRVAAQEKLAAANKEVEMQQLGVEAATVMGGENGIKEAERKLALAKEVQKVAVDTAKTTETDAIKAGIALSDAFAGVEGAKEKFLKTWGEGLASVTGEALETAFDPKMSGAKKKQKFFKAMLQMMTGLITSGLTAASGPLAPIAEIVKPLLDGLFKGLLGRIPGYSGLVRNNGNWTQAASGGYFPKSSQMVTTDMRSGKQIYWDETGNPEGMLIFNQKMLGNMMGGRGNTVIYQTTQHIGGLIEGSGVPGLVDRAQRVGSNDRIARTFTK